MSEYINSVLLQAKMLYHIKCLDENTLGNSANMIYEVEIDKTPYILRISEYSDKKLSHINFELNWIDYLALTIDNIAKPVRSINGRLFEVVKTEEKSSILCLFEKAEGRIVDSGNIKEYNDKLFYNLGVLMGQMHKQTSEYSGNIPSPDFEWYNNVFFDVEYNVIIDEVVSAFEKRYINELCSLPKNEDIYGIIHNDIHIHNFFINNGNIKLFDFDDCHFCWYACDIASTLFHMVQFSGAKTEKERTEFAETCLISYLKGYTQQYKISVYWLNKLDLFMRYRMTCVYKFAQNHWRNEPIHPHQWYLDWHKNRIINDIPYVYIDYDKVIKTL